MFLCANNLLLHCALNGSSAKELQVQMERLEEEKRARKLEEIRRREKATEDFLMGRDLPPQDPNQPMGLFG